MSLSLDDLFALKLCEKINDKDAGIKDFAATAVSLVSGESAEQQILSLLKLQLSFNTIFKETLPNELAKVSPGEETLKFLADKFPQLNSAKIKLFLWNNYLLQSVAEYFAHVRMSKANTDAGEAIFSEEAIKFSEERVALFWNAAQKLSH